MRKLLAIFTLSVFMWWGFHKLGPSGIFWGWIGWGIVGFIYYAVKDLCVGFLKFIDPAKPRNVNLTVYNGEARHGISDDTIIEGKARRSNRNPDPTRPSDDDFAGLITVRLKGGKR